MTTTIQELNTKFVMLSLNEVNPPPPSSSSPSKMMMMTSKYAVGGGGGGITGTGGDGDGKTGGGGGSGTGETMVVVDQQQQQQQTAIGNPKTNPQLVVVNGEGTQLEFFKKTVNRKTNIYSTLPVSLISPWTFWVDRVSRRGVGVDEYEAHLKRIYTVYTVHLFWGVYCNIPCPSTLKPQSSLHMMRDERKPVWEEEYNSKGGTFRMRVQKKDTSKVWRELLIAAAGEQLNEFVTTNDEVCGVSVSIRDREDLIQIWNTNAEEASNARIFDCVRMLLPDTSFTSEFYKPHISHHAFGKQQKIRGGGGHGPGSNKSVVVPKPNGQ